jgi:hypothetical protein
MMRITGTPFALSLIILFSTTNLLAWEQKTTFNTDTIKFESGTGQVRCQDRCMRKSGPGVESLLSQGWRIISSTPKEITGEDYYYIPSNASNPRGCKCIGTEYVLERDQPAPRAESADTGPYPPYQQPQAGVTANGAVSQINEIELLRKKNELLLKEIMTLRRENETLRNQMREIGK